MRFNNLFIMLFISVFGLCATALNVPKHEIVPTPTTQQNATLTLASRKYKFRVKYRILYSMNMPPPSLLHFVLIPFQYRQ